MHVPYLVLFLHCREVVTGVGGVVDLDFQDQVIEELLPMESSYHLVMADLVLVVVSGLNKAQGAGRKSRGLNVVVVKRRRDLIEEHQNILPQLMSFLLWGQGGLLLKVEDLKEADLRVGQWNRQCLTISMVHLCVDSQVVCLCLICLVHLKCLCQFLVLGKSYGLHIYGFFIALCQFVSSFANEILSHCHHLCMNFIL